MRKLIPAIFLFFNISMASVHAGDSNEAVAISQQGITYAMLDEYVSISLERKKFEIRFTSKPYTKNEFNALKVTASENNEIFEKIHIGDKIDQVDFFAPGTGMAAAEDGYSSIFINNGGHHYLYYSNEKDHRATLIFRQKELLLLEWPVSSYTFNKEEQDFENSNLQKLYLVIVNDINNNDIAEAGELNKVTISFK